VLLTVLFELENVAFGWPGGRILVDGVSLVFRQGEMVRISGPSGCGKTTFLRLFNRLLDPLAGQIRADGRALDDWPVERLRRQVAYLQQEPVMVEGTVRTNLLLPFSLEVAKGDAVPEDGVLGQYLRRFKLTGVALGDDASRLSTGQRQRLALIRLLLMEPAALLADEPVSALDEESREIVMAAINRNNRESGTTVLFVSHVDWHGLGSSECRSLAIDPGGRRLVEQTGKDEDSRHDDDPAD
jgi:putative ABC transport system ATP-binding protein